MPSEHCNKTIVAFTSDEDLSQEELFDFDDDVVDESGAVSDETKDSCRPDLAVEPGSQPMEQSEDKETDQATSDDSIIDETSQPIILDDKGPESQQFVPTRGKIRKASRSESNQEIISMMQKIIDKDPSTDLINFMKKDLEKSREHELKLFAMLCNTSGAMQPHSSAPIPNHPTEMFPGRSRGNIQHRQSHPSFEPGPSTSGSYIARDQSNIFQRMRYNMFEEDEDGEEKTYQTL
ncbi:hypothetical protein LOTGIDRAFT_158509 [Lottia gigantea]|uniref:Uncharacterized protein n=1 Tax=Lottia gigantea TaxID=225164 RepID=V4A6A2_LOTGI|nr:hypothetical protein LOTGIDRAFT_158509 [Lottia gigantea]ESO99423.1 hypothetical protein LOTGIDRAFT_158509 [Lottia gigantea]